MATPNREKVEKQRRFLFKESLICEKIPMSELDLAKSVSKSNALVGLPIPVPVVKASGIQVYVLK